MCAMGFDFIDDSLTHSLPQHPFTENASTVDERAVSECL